MNGPSQSSPSVSASTSTAPSTAPTATPTSAAPRHASTPPAPPALQRTAPSTSSSVASASAGGAVKPPTTTPQQVAAAAAAIAASRAASVSAAMRSVFGNNAANAAKQAALASAMMNAAAASASKQPAATPVPAPSQSAATTTPKASALSTMSTTGGSTVVVMQSSFDGLPVLPSQAAACCEDDVARLHALTCEFDVPRDGAVSLYGEPTTRHDVRKSLVQLYAATNQLRVGGDDHDDVKSSGSACGITEMTLRVDTEMEMLRRQCFAERNARWQFHTPDMYTFAMKAEPTWVSAPYIGPRKKTQLLRKRHELLRVQGNTDKASTAETVAMLESETLLQSLLGVELVRDRAWPPKEFVSKANSKPSRGGSSAANNANRTSSGKKKPVGMAGVVDETPTEARVCAECQTQSSALWRKRPRPAITRAGAVAGLVPAEALPGAVQPAAVGEVEEDDVCLPCFLKTQRRDLFDRKAAEKIRKAKEEASRAAAEARALKKQQQQMQKKLRKLAASQQSQPQSPEPEPVDSRAHVDVNEELTTPSSTTLTFVLKEERGSNGSSSRLQLKPSRRDSLSAAVGGDVSSGAEGWSSAVDEKKRKSEKKSKKDKKKKKKKKKKKTASSDWDDSESDDDGAASSVILPSPPQRTMDGFVYADRSEITAAAASSALDHFKHEDPASGMSSETVSIDVEVETTTTAKSKRSSSSSKRQSSSSSRSTTASSKKRKSSEAFADTPLAATVSVATTHTPPTPTASSSRSSRAKASSSSSSVAAPPTAASPAAAATPSARKRARPTKKESARERELRALGQYCPVCNMTYEEDDASPFVCCDSCEMWVHAACDASLSPEALAALADSNEKYICPLCSGR